MNLPEPTADESQPQFAARCHTELAAAIPETDTRNRAILQQWRKHRGPTDAVERKARERFGNEKFIKVEDVPIWAEHVSEDGEGNKVVYDRLALEAIAKRCNERILDTGNFCPITDGHTPDEADAAKGAPTPDVLGYCGNFRVGMIGNKHPRAAIFVDEYHHAEDAEKLRKKVRRSVELWSEERMEDRFFDPIAALGANTPRLDVGHAYAKRQARDGSFVKKYAARRGLNTEKYVMCAPGAAAVSPKKWGNAEKHAAPAPSSEAPDAAASASQQPDNGGGKLSMPITPEDCKTIVDAIDSLDWVQEFKQMAPALREMVGSHGSSGSRGSSGDSSGSPSGFSSSGSPSGHEMVSGSPSDSSGSPSGSPSGFALSGSPSGEKHKFAAGEDEPSDSPSGSPSGEVDKSKYDAAEGGDPKLPGEIEVPNGGATDAKKDKKYAAAATVAGNIDNPKEATAVGKIVNDTGATVADPKVMKMAKRRDKKDKYTKMRAEIDQLKAEARDRGSRERSALRYARLSDLKSDGYVFELSEELEETKDFTDEQFNTHCERRIKKYSKAPVGNPMLPTPQFREHRGEPDKFAKQVRDKVIELNDAQNRAYDAAVKRSERPAPRKDFYALQQEAETLVKGGGGTVKTA